MYLRIKFGIIKNEIHSIRYRSVGMTVGKLPTDFETTNKRKLIIVDIFAERLKELRTDKGLSIQALSNEVKIGVASICRWENCQADVKGSQLIILAKFFGVTIDYLLGLEN